VTRAAGAGILLLVLTACDLAAGLDRFVPANAGSGGAAGTGASGTGASSTGGSAGTAGGDCADHLVISEVRTRGDAGATDDFVEVFNPTSATVELAGWKLLSRAPTVSDTERQKWLGVGEMLPPGGHLLVAGMGFDDGATPDRILDPSTSFGDDVRILLRNPVGDLVDIVCVCGTGCAAGSWDGCTAGPIQNPNVTPAGDKLARDFSLVRNPECRDTDAADDFVEADSTAASLTSP
jgi:hypothetical protein